MHKQAAQPCWTHSAEPYFLVKLAFLGFPLLGRNLTERGDWSLIVPSWTWTKSLAPGCFLPLGPLQPGLLAWQRVSLIRKGKAKEEEEEEEEARQWQSRPLMPQSLKR